jgi:hypothetical protein
MAGQLTARFDDAIQSSARYIFASSTLVRSEMIQIEDRRTGLAGFRFAALLLLLFLIPLHAAAAGGAAGFLSKFKDPVDGALAAHS